MIELGDDFANSEKKHLTREEKRRILSRRIAEISHRAGQFGELLPLSVVNYLGEKPSSGSLLNVLTNYVNGAAGLPLHADASARVASPSSETQSTADADSTDHD